MDMSTLEIHLQKAYIADSYFPSQETIQGLNTLYVYESYKVVLIMVF